MAIDGFQQSRVTEDIEGGIYEAIYDSLVRSAEEKRPPQEIIEEFCRKKLAAIKESNDLKI